MRDEKNLMAIVARYLHARILTLEEYARLEIRSLVIENSLSFQVG